MKTKFIVVSMLVLLSGIPIISEVSANGNVEYFYQRDNNGWEYVGDIHVSTGYGYYAEIAKLYVKVIGGKSFYKIKINGSEYAVINSKKSGYKYEAGPYYFNM